MTMTIASSMGPLAHPGMAQPSPHYSRNPGQGQSQCHQAPNSTALMNLNRLLRDERSISETTARIALQLQERQRLDREIRLCHLQKQQHQQHTREAAMFAAAGHFTTPMSVSQKIIGMGICVPNPPISALQGATASHLERIPPASKTFFQAPPQVQAPTVIKTNKIAVIGKPLRAPPRLARGICTKKRPACTTFSNAVPQEPMNLPPISAALTEDSIHKRRKVGGENSSSQYVMHAMPVLQNEGARRVSLPFLPHSPVMGHKKQLSLEELDFLEAANRLCDVSGSMHSPDSPPKRIMTSLLPLPSLMTTQALMPPPSLYF